ncbi:MAG: thioredoxin family protein [Deltaproteobacteria bacterium]|nr:thioredoxin family protein [Deltaproteobacteria bacterium]
MDRARPGDAIILAIVADIKKGFHLNANAQQVKSFENFRPYPTKVTVADVSGDITIESPRYPKAVPIKVEYAAGDLMSFEGQTVIYLPIKLEETIKPGSLGLKLVFEYQACSDTYCLFPAKIKFEGSLTVVESGTGVSKINEELFVGFDQGSTASTSREVNFDLFGWTFAIDVSSEFGMILLLITAGLGGMLLNLTPCVLPLIPIKIISLSHVAQNRKQCFMLGLAMFGGVLVFWLVIGVLIALVSDFSATNQLFQYPAFTILIGAIIGSMASGMFGLFSVRLPNFIYMLNPEQDTLHGSFGLGILAAILSTPCTAPFMGAAAAWASTQAPATTLAAFAAIGIGMALPYLVLSASPAWVEKMPKTGPASELIKQVMGLFMLAAAVYFIGIGVAALFSKPPNPPTKLYWWPVMFFCIAAGGWLAYRTLQITARVKLKAFYAGIGVIIMALSAWGAVQLTDPGPVDWVYYTPQRFLEASDDKKVVVMVFTAEWCLNCKALEQGVFKDSKIVTLFATEDIVPMKVDITGNNPAGKAKLKEVGTLTIPLLVIYSPVGKQVFKSDFYTADQVYEAVTKALEGSGSSF